MARGDARAALPQANAAVVAEPNNAAGWRLMARAANAIEPRDYRERWELRERAITAAYLAYQRSTNRNDEAGLARRARPHLREERALAPGADDLSPQPRPRRQCLAASGL
jgi:hypothetical protein